MYLSEPCLTDLFEMYFNVPTKDGQNAATIAAKFCLSKTSLLNWLVVIVCALACLRRSLHPSNLVINA